MQVSVTQVQRWETSNPPLLVPERDEETGRVWHMTEQVVELSKTWQRKRAPNNRRAFNAYETRYRGEKAAVCFPYFQTRASFDIIVIETRTDPKLVRELYEEYLLDLDGGQRERNRKREEERETKRQYEHRRKLERAEHRKHQMRLAQELARGGLAHLPTTTPETLLKKAERAAAGERTALERGQTAGKLA